MSNPNEKPRVVPDRPGSWYGRSVIDGRPFAPREVTNAGGVMHDFQTWVLSGRIKPVDHPDFEWSAPVPSSDEAAAMREVCEKARAMLKLHEPPTEDEPTACFELHRALAKLDALKGGG